MPGIVLLFIVVFFWVNFTRIRISFGNQPKADSKNKPQQKQDMKFYCRAETVTEFTTNGQEQNLIVSMRGCVVAPAEMFDTDIQVLLADVTEGLKAARPILCSVRKWQMEDSPAFCYKVHNGKLPRKVSQLTNWVQVVSIPASYLKFPRQGRIKLEVVTSILASKTSQELACGNCVIEYDNPSVGYIDSIENNERAERLTIELALAAGKLNNISPVNIADTVRKWIDTRNEQQAVPGLKKRLRDALVKGVESLQAGKECSIDSLCSDMCKSATILERYSAIELCIAIIGADKNFNPGQIDTVKQISQTIQVDQDKFRAMVLKILPFDKCRTLDTNFILGINPDMETEKIRQRINEEYKKWNARITHPDEVITQQADQMLTIIAEARKKYIEQPCHAN